ncbi:hypothetical protein SLS56_011000 [Neofusicoccum ribis]|uniref:N-acetyltransferase domain-containing protein n=1 Tax=Neofusicoccum ribis TaxID=45134 RepID=A0ABR3SCX8_9PEZI
MFNEPLLKFDDCKVAVDAWSAGKDPHYYAVLSGAASDPSSEPAGVMSYLSVVPDHRRIEIGCIIFGERLKQTRGTTEASYLLLKHAFEDLGYLRVEWKADALNKPSAIAAERLGFVYEGIFRQRDTIWFSMTDTEWPTVKAHLEAWLHAGNFDGSGKQRQGLRDLSAGSKVNPTEETS